MRMKDDQKWVSKEKRKWEAIFAILISGTLATHDSDSNTIEMIEANFRLKWIQIIKQWIIDFF